MIDFYFKKPVLWDFLISTILACLITYYTLHNQVSVPDREKLNSIISDLSTISLTLAGFVLTLLTVLISFKSSYDEAREGKKPNSTFQFFFTTPFYFQTVNHLKNAVISLTLIAFIGYALKLMGPSMDTRILFAYDILGASVVFLTLWRCLTILSKVIRLQQHKSD